MRLRNAKAFTFNNVWFHIEQLDCSQDARLLHVWVHISERFDDSRLKILIESIKFQMAQASKRQTSNFWVLMFEILEECVDSHDSQVRVSLCVVSEIKIDHFLLDEVVCVGSHAHFGEKS